MAVTLLRDQPDLLKERLRQAPEGAGVYVMRDSATKVMYVGKASNLRNRLRTWFGRGPMPDLRLDTMIAKVFDFDILTCATEQEALLLENTLIKRYRPRYNIRLRDDKNYLYMKIPRAGDFPRVYTVRKITDDKAFYFGPYTNAGALRSTMKTLRRIFPYRTCSDEVFKRGHVCLDYHIKRCSGPCEGLIGSEDYHGNLEQIGVFMEGRTDELVRDIRSEMKGASDRLEFERAARLRDRASAVEKVAENQSVRIQARREQDVIALAQSVDGAAVAVLTVRGGQVLGGESFELEGAQDVPPADVLNGFLGQFYSNATSYPREILLPVAIPDQAVLEGFLAQRRGARVAISVPARGARRRLVEMAEHNAGEALRQSTIKKDYDADRSGRLLADLQEALGMDRPPRRIECFDISNLMGTDPVGSMVVFEDGRPKQAHYRRFHVNSVEGANDFAMMQEVLRRRFARLVARREAVAGKRRTAEVDSSFTSLPDLVIIDGGPGQLGAARKVMEEVELHQIATFGLAKRKEVLYQAGSSHPLLLPVDSPALFLLQRIRDEAHRFAVGFHRRTRARERLASPLDTVPGLGPKRKRQLIKRFRSLAGIRAATVAELQEVVPEKVARALQEQI
jgi:excinuclease ABC subunit C